MDAWRLHVAEIRLEVGGAEQQAEHKLVAPCCGLRPSKRVQNMRQLPCNMASLVKVSSWTIRLGGVPLCRPMLTSSRALHNYIIAQQI